MLGLALAIAGFTGFVALSYEVVWYRVISFATWGRPAAFGLLLGIYLVGIAIGSIASRRFCRDEDRGNIKSLRALGTFLLCANVASFLVVPAMGYALTISNMAISGALVLVAIAAGMMGATLPLLCHLAIPPNDRAGEKLSYVYFANIVGSTLGSLLTGFVFMDTMTLAHTCLVLAVLFTLMGASLLVVGSGPIPVRRVRAVFVPGLMLVALFFLAPGVYDQLYERLQFRAYFEPSNRFAEIIETKSGVITVTSDATVYGGGGYDGRLNTSIVHDRNGIVRAYALSALHPAPKEVLMIGLASGSWAQVIANNPEVAHLTIVEINPGYLELISHHGEVAGVLKNPKITIEIDDGRRWLRRHNERLFDVIVMNTTWHWRAHLTNLLSSEFMSIARSHLAPNGLFYFNTTSSRDVQKTAMTVFPYGMRFINFVAVSDSPIHFDKNRFREILTNYKIENRPAIDVSTTLGKELLDSLVSIADTLESEPTDDGLESRESILARTQDATVVTDDNMAVEFQDPLSMFETPE